ncbi:MAG TPA: hypothetical protein VKY85_12305 [Candidatus Angelobacter sp.]|nr:hypothetical protein [Candidatus Angelobacter sp.]
MTGPQSISRLIEQGTFLLKTFHSEYSKDPVSRETEFWRGNLACWRGTLYDFFREHAEEILNRVRESTGLPMPHRGILAPDGSGYLGWDSGAEF